MAAPHPLLIPLITGTRSRAERHITPRIAESAIEHGVAPLLHAMLERNEVAAPRAVALELLAQRLASEAQWASAISSLEAFASEAERHGCRIVVFKGAATAHELYSSVELRPITDVDVLVGADDRRRLAGLLSHFDDRVAEAFVAWGGGAPFDHAIEVEGQLVDLHTDPVKLVIREQSVGDWWDRAHSRRLPGGTSVLFADRELSTYAGLVHGLRDCYGYLLQLVDLHLLWASLPDWRYIEERARLEGTLALVRYSAYIAAELLGERSPLSTTVQRVDGLAARSLWPRRYMLRGAESDTRALRRQALAGLLVRSRRIEVARALTRRAFPPRAVIDSSGTVPGPYPTALIRWRAAQKQRTGIGS